MDLLKSKTYVNLATAFAGECQARVRYEFIEYGLRQKGFKEMAELVDEIVYNEFNHARMFYTKIQDASDKEIKNIDISGGFPFKEKWDIEENLRLGIEDEKAEVMLYPEFGEIAKKEGFPDIATLFFNIAKIEECHQKRFTTLYNQFKNGEVYKKKTPVKWKCAGCGYEETGKSAPKTCPVCQAKQGTFKLNLDEEN